jgi:N-acyl homoserine lactone hydrolase
MAQSNPHEVYPVAEADYMADIKTKGLPAGLNVLLPGVPGLTSRGFLGYCTVTLFTLDGKGEWGLFDTGHYSDRNLLLSVLNKAGVEPAEIRHVVLSHLHFDHVLNLPLFPRAEVYVSQAEIDYAEQVAAGSIVDHAVPDFWTFLLKNRSVHRVEEEHELGPSCRLTVRPGHTPGGIVMLCKGSENTAVCGDVIKNAWEAASGKAAMAASAKDAAESIRVVMAQAEVIIPGHDRPFRHFQRGLEFLSPFQWEVRTNLYPEPLNNPVLVMERIAARYLY